MTLTESEKIAEMLRILVELLTQNKFEEISKKYPSEYHLTAEEIREAIELYPCKLVTPPDEEFRNFDAVEVENHLSKIWDVRFTLWTVEEGRSDLTIVLDVKETPENDYVIGLRDILVS